MTDVELRLTADLDQATKEVAGFRKEYADMVRAIEKPLRQVNATRNLERDLEATGKSVRGVKDELSNLQRELINTDRPSQQLRLRYRDAGNELQRLERLEAQQANQLRKMRAELAGAGVDTSRLSQEQRRLNNELNAGLAAGRGDAATVSLRNRAAALGQVAREQRLANIEAAKSDLGINRYRALQAELVRLQGQYQTLRTSGSLTARELAVAQSNLTLRIRETNQALRDTASAQAAGAGIGGTVAGFAGGLGAVEALRGYINATDQAKKMEAQLRLATTSQEEFNRAQAETFRIAQENQAPLADVVTLYSRLTPALREVGRGQGDALKIIEAVTKSLRISGATAQETASTIQQFSQALGSGVLRGEEFNALAEASPRLLRALADGLNVNVGALRAMAADGQLTADVISDVLIGQLPKLAAEAAQLPETFSGAATRFNNQLIGAITTLDKFTGASETAIGSIGRFSSVLGAISTAKAPSWLEQFGKTFKLLSNTKVQDSALSFLFFGFSEAQQQAEQESQVYSYREGLFDLHAKEMKVLREQHLKDSTDILDRQVKDTKSKLKEQVDAERSAARDLATAKKAQLDTQKRYQEALTKLNAGAAGDPSFSTANALKVGARNALQTGDVEEAKRQAQAALEVLTQLAAAGENTYGFAGIIKELQAIEGAADQKGIDEAQAKLDKANEAVEVTRAALESLKDLKITAGMSPEDEQAVLTQMAELAKKIGILLTVPVTPVGAPGSVDASPAPPAPAAATGGIFRGPGTGTSDSIWARVSNGEGVLTARAVSHYGPSLVHELNRLRVPKFAAGGVIGERALPNIPPLAQALRQQLDGPNFPDLGRLDLNFGGERTTVYVERSGAESFQRLAMKKGGTRRSK